LRLKQYRFYKTYFYTMFTFKSYECGTLPISKKNSHKVFMHFPITEKPVITNGHNILFRFEVSKYT